MSYCRFGKDSDVYMFPSGRGIECCACHLNERVEADPVFGSADEALAHLRKHAEAGHRVPHYAIDRLEAEATDATEGSEKDN